MACMELLHISKDDGKPDVCNNVDWSLNNCYEHDEKVATSGTAFCHESQCISSHWVAPSDDLHNSVPLPPPFEVSDIKSIQHGYLKGKKKVCCAEELETTFTYLDENVNVGLVSPPLSIRSCQVPPHDGSYREIQLEGTHDPSMISDDETISEASGKSVDYGFISAVTFLVTGIVLVILSYVIPRDVNVDPNSISAREMEHLQKKSAYIGAHLDRCVIAGLCLLTLGGVVLSTLLMVSMWKGELYRRNRFSNSKESANCTVPLTSE
ncbi:transmembrane protein 74-like [Rhinatrema bivittatum]|uniref:transmembrane protein 74-like n=1 Tax=Rhinatrema bivittatum TaxID=194408 RepID=UPI001128D803|nr:transmembrane protein 74-like [Rhinatrema bivittatum]